MKFNARASLVAFGLIVIAAFGMIGLFVEGVHSISSARAEGFPKQSQASNLAVPDVKQYPYASAVIVSQCNEAVAVLFTDHNGDIHPQHFKDLTYKELMSLLRESTPADKVTEVTVTCPKEIQT